MTKQWSFSIVYESRGLVIRGEATVTGSYDGPSKPEEMVRAALASTFTKDSLVRIHLFSPDEGQEADR